MGNVTIFSQPWELAIAKVEREGADILAMIKDNNAHGVRDLMSSRKAVKKNFLYVYCAT